MRYPHDPQLLARVLDCYKPHCRYLRELTVETSGQHACATGTFEIPESCYIDATGHLNSVEVNIGYNQMLYQTIAVLVRHQDGPLFDGWTMDEFWRRQLPDILITRFDSTFRRPIDPRRFHGDITFAGFEHRVSGADGTPYLALDTEFHCWDDAGGNCSGNARIAVVGAPRRLEAVQ
ncbi:FcoT family thioesterase [Nocardia sp. NPDC052566]|uniref:FcoT family thioesterase n=1 Tax=Nocardia sp. NPDC052566 TaxID=3364330 RepID=UPI0037C98D3A